MDRYKYIKQHGDKLKEKRYLTFLNRWHKFNGKEQNKEGLKICRDCDKKFGTHLEELELRIQEEVKNGKLIKQNT